MLGTGQLAQVRSHSSSEAPLAPSPPPESSFHPASLFSLYLSRLLLLSQFLSQALDPLSTNSLPRSTSLPARPCWGLFSLPLPPPTHTCRLILQQLQRREKNRAKRPHQPSSLTAVDSCRAQPEITHLVLGEGFLTRGPVLREPCLARLRTAGEGPLRGRRRNSDSEPLLTETNDPPWHRPTHAGSVRPVRRPGAFLGILSCPGYYYAVSPPRRRTSRLGLRFVRRPRGPPDGPLS